MARVAMKPDSVSGVLNEDLSPHVLRGTAVSTGVGRGTAFVLACAAGQSAPRRSIAESALPEELARFQAALDRADRELFALRAEVSEKIGPSEAEIFASQALMLKDSAFHSQISAVIQEQRINAEAALTEVLDKLSHAFDEIHDAYLRERAADVRDIGRRVLLALAHEHENESFDIPEGAVIVADELPPSVTARLELGHVRAFVTGRGGKFSHTSILARSQGMPAVSGVINAARGIKTGDELLVDAFTGTVFVNPSHSVRREYDRLQREIEADREKLARLVPLPALTVDGVSVGLSANVSKVADLETALLHNADGIGLYRTEFAFAIRNRFPSEAEQVDYFERVAARMHPRRVVFRLLDIGGDKELPYFALPPSRNPSLSERGVRVLLRYPEILKLQLRSLLRVSATHPIAVLLPMVAGVEDVRRTREILRQVERELTAEGLPFAANIPLGAMIEVPAAALSAAALAREVDFLSLGTNDLAQYVLAADREDENVAQYYQPAHPALLQLIHRVATVANESDRSLTICGDMAGDPAYTELLLGLGLRHFSVATGSILDVKHRIRTTSLCDAQELAARALQLGSVTEVEALLEERHPPSRRS